MDKSYEQADDIIQTSQLLDGSSRVVYLGAHRMAIVEDTRARADLVYEIKNCDGEVCTSHKPKSGADTSGSSSA